MMVARAAGFVLLVLNAAAVMAAAAGSNAGQFLPAIPAGYHLQAYDDCGVACPPAACADEGLLSLDLPDERHRRQGLKERSAVFSYKGVQAVYTNLDPKLSYVLALTYANDHVYHRVQSLEAGNGIVLHGPYELPKGMATRVIVKVPWRSHPRWQADPDWKLLAKSNVTVSIIELWADAPAPPACGSAPWRACRTACRAS